jgi:hypothetical protein
MMKTIDLPLMRLWIAQVAPKQDLDALVLEAVNGSARGLVDKAGRRRSRICGFVSGRKHITVSIDRVLGEEG